MAPAAPAHRRKLALRNKKKKITTEPALGGENASNAELEAIVFGKSLQLPSEDNESVDDAELSEADMADDGLDTLSLAVKRGGKKEGKRKKKGKRAVDVAAEDSDEDEVPLGVSVAAWEDPDDAELEVDLTQRNRTKKLRRTDEETTVDGHEYERRLRDQFVKMNGAVGWAEKRPGHRDADASSDSEEDFYEAPATSAMPLADGAGRGLRPHQLDIKCLQRVDIAPPSAEVKAAVVQSLQFHPESELMLTAGLDKTLRIFSVDGTENARVAAYFFKKFPITGAAFTPDGDQVVITGRGFKMWGLDVRTGEPTRIEHHCGSLRHEKYRGLVTGPCPSDAPSLRANKMYSVLGDAGAVLVCDVPSKQPVRTLRMSAPGVAAVFSAERDVLWSADEDCNLYEWDLATGRCKQRVKAAFATGICSLALRRVTANAPTPVLAVGTTTGNIDMYDISKPQLSAEPYKSIDSLTTMVTSLRFHPEGEVLLGASKFKKEALRLMHSGTGTVFSNWPTQKTPLNRITSVDFSRQGGMLAMANERGKVLLYQLRHYEKMA